MRAGRGGEAADDLGNPSPAGLVGSAIDALVAELPKVELHVHLEGSMQPATLLALARRHGVELPADDEAGLSRWFRFKDFEHFVQIYLTCSSCLQDPEDFHRLALDFLREQGRQRIVYSEVHFTIGTHLANGRDGEAVLQALDEAAKEGRERFGARVAWIPDIVRNVPVENADRTLEWAVAGRDRGVVALGLSGIEARFPNEPFQEHFATAARHGLRRVAHAGEHGGAASIRSVLDLCGAERIGHGVRAVEEEELMIRLRDEGVPLEVCPTSNVCLGVVDALADHPFERLRQAGLAVSVNSDDPPFFGTTLNDEYIRLARTFGYGVDDVVELIVAGVEHSFLPLAEKEALKAEVQRRATEVQAEQDGLPLRH